MEINHGGQAGQGEQTEGQTARYERRIVELIAQRAQVRSQDVSLTWARGFVFLSACVVAFIAWGGVISWWWLLLPVVAFFALAIWHEQVAERFIQIDLLREIYRQQLARHHRRLSELPTIDIEIPQRHQSLAADLDLFGPRSVFQWICVAATPMGRETLRDWLLVPADKKTIEARQVIVRSLAEESQWREALQLEGARLGRDPESVSSFLKWAEGDTWLHHHWWLSAVAWISPLILLAGIVLFAIQAVPAVAALSMIGASIAINIVISICYTPRIHETFYAVAGRANQVSHYRSMLKLARSLPERVGPVSVGERDLREVSHAGFVELSHLERIVGIANARRDAALFVLYFLTQLTLLRDVHLLTWLEHWQRHQGREASHWFAAIGQLEALTSLATVAYEHPDWAYPQIDEQSDTWRAGGLGHPLLPNEKRVTNDVELGPAGTFLLVTGSNMSGKSTLLRSIGVNTLLAQAGSVVCARNLHLPPLALGTSIRVNDSLAEGVSFFLAELLRLKQIVDQARESQAEGRRLLYLLDEILQGTNSRERHIAVIHILQHLIAQRAIGAVSTHDLELATAGELRDSCRVVHFRETLAREAGHTKMTFDYHLRPGVAPTTNALVLLEIVGL